MGKGAVNVYGIRLVESADDGGQQLLWLPSITVEGTLWRALSGQGLIERASDYYHRPILVAHVMVMFACWQKQEQDSM